MRTVLTIAAATTSGSTVGIPPPSSAPEASSVRTAAGSIAEILTPVPAYSRRAASDAPSAANLLALYVTIPGIGIIPAMEATFTT